jgi:AcrR family transcriptional regulator
MTGLREQKKAQTRTAIAAAASDLFARDGYASVTMAQVATAAGVSDQTLYNYFPTKESLVFDQAGAFEESLLTAIAQRPDGVDVLAAFRAWLDAFLLGDAARRAVAHPGGMPQLVATSDALRRMLLDVAHGVASQLAAQLHTAEAMPEPGALVLADAMLAVTVRTTEALGAAAGPQALKAVTRQAHASVDALQALAPAADLPHEG